MKRFIISLSLTLCTTCFAFAQVFISNNMSVQRPAKILDNALLQAVYKASSVGDSSNLDRVAVDTMILQVGSNRISKFFADTRVRDSILQAQIGQRLAAMNTTGVNVSVRNVGSAPSGSSGGNQSIVFKNYPSGSFTVTDRIMMDDYTYTEPYVEIEWEILPDTDTLLSYPCQKAVATFRGRSYEAWFAPAIPLNDGPWKFNGLPGLILKVSDTRQHYIFECIGLEQTSAAIEYADVDYLKTNRRDLARVKRKFYEDPLAAMESMRASAPAGAAVRVVARNADGSTADESEIRNRMRNRAYNPIELDY